ncbi:MAG: nucleotide exchange factor GrpE [Bacteroidales bacterium]|nr:nucleotide exchange factor GrpE [Bacteroidales bacterium]MDD6731222.1 nucleotide exchange factor GrpE [Bacteroidales bacterium]
MSNKNKEQKETENIINNDTDNTQQVPENDTPLEQDAEVINEDSKSDAEADKLAEALTEIDSLKDKYLRQVAEFDNYRKRTLKEKTELILNGGEKVLSALLPVLDDLDRAMQNIEKSNDVETLKEGVTLIIDKLTKILQGQGLQKMDTVGKEFDTDFHEAVALIPAPEEAQKNHVIDCVQPGYMLNEKVIRHAKVVVGQ